MACCSSPQRDESRKARQSLSRSFERGLGESEEYVRESRVAERVTELISPAWPPPTRGKNSCGKGWCFSSCTCSSTPLELLVSSLLIWSLFGVILQELQEGTAGISTCLW